MVVVGSGTHLPGDGPGRLRERHPAIATKLWRGLPKRPPEALCGSLRSRKRRQGRATGSQDMIGLIYPGVNRLDYDYAIHGGVFPCHIEP